MGKLPELSEEEYLEIEEALSANARGRAFLRMRDKRSRMVSVEDVRRLFRSLKDGITVAAPTPDPGSSTHLKILRQELQEMSSYIQQTRQEIAALRPEDSGTNRIMAATEELDAIVT
ncbi:MAG TPA: hypothetical protein VEH84_05285, partial [Alphaproteobacteria bacterium]|nr:hypothetical protein [Alphaproteobacteria bacterium]